MGAILFDLHDASAAAKELRTAVTLNPANVEAHRLLARIDSQENDPSGAERELLQRSPSKPSAEVYFEFGLTEAQLGNSPTAARGFSPRSAINPRYASAHLMLGELLRRQGDHAGALAQFRKAAELAPDDPEAQYDLGKEFKAGGDLAGAIAAFRRAIELKPDFESAHYNLGITLRSEGETAKAKQELNELDALHEFRERLAQSKLLILQGVDALKQQKVDEALRLFQESADRSPNLPTSYYYLGVTWERKNDAASASSAYEKAIALLPDYAQALTSYGSLLWRMNDRERGLEELQRAAMSDPDLPEAHYNLGLALAQAQRLDEAVMELKQAISLDPQYVDARVQLGLVLSEKSDLVGAANVFRELLRRDPKFAEIHNNLGLVLLQSGISRARKRNFSRPCA